MPESQNVSDTAEMAAEIQLALEGFLRCSKVDAQTCSREEK